MRYRISSRRERKQPCSPYRADTLMATKLNPKVLHAASSSKFFLASCDDIKRAGTRSGTYTASVDMFAVLVLGSKCADRSESLCCDVVAVEAEEEVVFAGVVRSESSVGSRRCMEGRRCFRQVGFSRRLGPTGRRAGATT